MTTTSRTRLGSISGCVIDCGKAGVDKGRPRKPPKGNAAIPAENLQPIHNANIILFCMDPETKGAVPEHTINSSEDGSFKFCDLPPRKYWVRCCAFAWENTIATDVTPGCDSHICFEVPLDFSVQALVGTEDCEPLVPCDNVMAGRAFLLRMGGDSDLVTSPQKYEWSAPEGGDFLPAGVDSEAYFLTTGLYGKHSITGKMLYLGSNAAAVKATTDVHIMPAIGTGPTGTGPAARLWGPGGSLGAGGAFGTGGAGGGGGISAGGAGGPFGGMPNIGVMLQRSAVPPTDRLGFWARIRNHAKAVSFGGATKTDLRGYQGFIERVLCEDRTPETRAVDARFPDGCPPPDAEVRDLLSRRATIPLHGMTAYELLMTATEVFLLWNCGVVIQPKDAAGHPLLSDSEEFSRASVNTNQMINFLASYLPSGRLPYIERVVRTAFPNYSPLKDSIFCANQLSGRADCVCLIELIWSYWLEEGMLVQTVNAISRRFQNIRGPGDRDPLAHLEIDPLRGLNNLIWGYLQNEQNQLTVQRRAYEYDHHYGLTIYGKAVPPMRAADSRSKFIEGFHNLLHRAANFYKEDNDTTVIADGFPLINALKEVHLLLAQGAHNQFGDLPWTARAEMMVQQWLLARPEMRDFLQSRAMVPYTESWMPQVDTMKTLQGWSDVTITHFRDLAVYGEQVLLSVRYDDWIDLNDENEAKNWARYWRPEIQGYIHAYRTVTGVDLTSPDTVDSTIPAVHLRKRLAMQQAR